MFGYEIASAMPSIFAHVISAVVACLVLVVKLIDMRVSFMISLVFWMVAFSYGGGGCIFLQMAESLETESLGLLSDLRADIAKEFKRMRLARLLTRRRLFRHNVGHFMFIESGTALAISMAVLDNTVSVIVMVATSATSYIMNFQ